MNIDKKNILKNAIISFNGQIFIMTLGIVVPRIFISSYGSDANGLLTTLTQIFTYMALLEAGIGQSARNALFKPIHENDRNGISYIFSAAVHNYRKIAIIYIIAVVSLSVIAPFVLKTKISHLTVFLVILFQGASGVISFYFVQTIIIMLNADGKEYVNSVVNLIYNIISYMLKIVLALKGVNIVFLQASFLVITLIKVIFYRLYFKKKYSWIDENAAPKDSKLPDRNSYIITEIAWTIFSSTDLIVLSTFVSTSLSSVYSVYNLVFVSINALLNAIYSSINYILGVKFHEGVAVYEKVHDAFMTIFIGTMTILMSVAYVLILPFIKIYTHGISDINYIYPELPLLFCLVQILSWSRYIQGNLTGIAGYAKSTSKVSLIEAVINLTLSIILVRKLEIIGVLLATVIALPLKVIYTTYISDKKVMHRSCIKSITIIGINLLLFSLAVISKKLVNIEIFTIFAFLLYGVILLFVIGIVGILVNLIVNPTCLKFIKSFRSSKIKER